MEIANDDGLQLLIPIINKLQDVFNTLGSDAPLDLPQICVVGSQSSGKSSVLEHIVGRDFLPRGSGIVTRRPLVLQLTQIAASSQSQPASSKPSEGGEEWGEFLHKPGQKYFNFEHIREEIARETDRLTGANKGISSQPINLKIYSPYVLNLTLVDLPGLTRVPVGDQPVDIERQIRTMIYHYTRQANALILAVTPANTDLATSDAIQLARDLDPEGQRTIGVLTKLDIMDRGTDALDILNNQVIQLKHGFVGIVNRSQEDIQSNISIRDALKKEARFFAEHPSYRKIASRCGTAFLSRTLNKRLLLHIRNTLPDLRARLAQLTSEAKNEMEAYGDPLLETQRGALLLQMLTKFARDYGDAIDGKNVSIHELFGGARINYIFNEMFGNLLDSYNPLHDTSEQEIRTAIRNAAGTSSPLFSGATPFQVLVKRKIATLEGPALECVRFVHEELVRIINQLEVREIARFKNLRVQLVEVVRCLLQDCRDPTEFVIKQLFAMEQSWVNLSHPDFIARAAPLANGQMTDLGLPGEQQQLLQQQHQPTPPTPAPVAQPVQPAPTPAPAPIPIAPTPVQQAPTPAPAPVVVQQPPVQQSAYGRQPAPPTRTQAAQDKGSFFNMFFGESKSAASTPAASTPAPGPAVASAPVPVSPAAGYPPSRLSASPAASQPARSGPAGYPSSFPASTPAPAPAPSPAPAPTPAPAGRTASPDPRQYQPVPAYQTTAAPAREEPPSRIPMQLSPVMAGDQDSIAIRKVQLYMVFYFDVIRKNIKDLVPKSCMHFLVNTSRKEMQNRLIQALYKPDMFDVLLEESPEVAERRRRCTERLHTLRKATAVINEVRDASIGGPAFH